MRQEFANYFFQQLQSTGPTPIASTVFQIGRPDGPPWRPDALFFLFSNLQLMVINPFNSVERTPNSPSSQAFFEALNTDIARIAALSEAIAASRGRPYVSATSVTKALGALVETLTTTSFQIWGPDPETLVTNP